MPDEATWNLNDGPLDRDSFYEAAMQAVDMPDQIELHLHKTDPDPRHGFSVDGFKTVGYQLHDFLMARTYAHWKREGHFPEGVKVVMQLVWDEDRAVEDLLRDSNIPWWQGDDPGALPAVDGDHRLSPFLDEREQKN